MDEKQSNTANLLSDKNSATSLGLSIPAQGPAPAGSMLIDPKDTQKWIAGLPMANIGETARQVYTALLNFNRYSIPDLIRAKSVEQFRSPVTYICNNLQRHYLDAGFPLSAKSWKTVVLSRELNAELAISYKIIIEHMLAGDNRHFDRKLLVIALHRAMHYLGRVLLQTSLAYSPWPPKVWKEINSLYAFASQNQVDQVPVKSTARKKEGISTIEDNYKALLMFASAAPFRMRQNHISQLFQRSHEWSEHTRLFGNNDGVRSPVGRFNIDLWADEAPVHNAIRSPSGSKHSIVIDLNLLLQKLRKDFEQAPLKNSSDIQNARAEMTRPLLRQLITAWSRPPERSFVRTKLNFELNVVTGLQAIHSNLEGGSGIQADNGFLDDINSNGETARQGSPSSPPQSKPVGKLSLSPLNADPNTDSLMNDSYLNTSLSGESAPDNLQTRQSHAVTQIASPTMKLHTNNESAGGYCIQWASENVSRVKVGELIGVASSSHRKQYGLGLIRWLRHSDKLNLEIGLQMISNHIEAAQVYRAIIDGNRRDSAAHRTNCLLLPSLDNDPTVNAPSLIMSNINFPVGSNLWLDSGSKERLIRLTRLIEFSNAFAQFQFTYVNPDNTSPVSTEQSDGNSDFNDLWTNL